MGLTETIKSAPQPTAIGAGRSAIAVRARWPPTNSKQRLIFLC
jgi:hypothetical protein